MNENSHMSLANLIVDKAKSLLRDGVDHPDTPDRIRAIEAYARMILGDSGVGEGLNSAEQFVAKELYHSGRSTRIADVLTAYRAWCTEKNQKRLSDRCVLEALERQNVVMTFQYTGEDYRNSIALDISIFSRSKESTGTGDSFDSWYAACCRQNANASTRESVLLDDYAKYCVAHAMPSRGFSEFCSRLDSLGHVLSYGKRTHRRGGLELKDL